MPVSNKYQLSEAFQSRDGELSIPGTEIATGRAVVMHLLVGGSPADNQQLRDSVSEVSGVHKMQVLEIGFQEGVHFVVTSVLPENPSLRAWLQSIANETITPLPAVSAPDLDETKAATKVPDAIDAGEFTRFFAQSGPPPPPTISANPPAQAVNKPAAPPLNKPPASPAPAPVPAAPALPLGEFTRFMSQSGGGVPPQPRASAPAPKPPSVPSASKVPAQPVQPPAPPPPPAVVPSPKSDPGEFTRFFSQTDAARSNAPTSAPTLPPSPVVAWGTPVSSPPAPQVPKAVPPPAASTAPQGTEPAPGEFTRLFASGASPAPSSGRPGEPVISPSAPHPPSPSSSPEPGEFTRNFQAPRKVQPGAPAESLFGLDVPMPSSSSPSWPGEFTRAMQSPLAPEPFRASNPPPAPKAVPSEFTRMMQLGGSQQSQPLPREEPRLVQPEAFPWKPAQQAGEYTKIFESPQVRDDQFPHSSTPIMPASSGGSGVFANPAPAPVRGSVIPTGPSDYTQMVNASSAARPAAVAPVSAEPSSANPSTASPAAKKPPAMLLIIVVSIFVIMALVLLVIFFLQR